MKSRHLPVTADAQRVLEDVRQAIERKGWSATSRLAGMDRTALHRAFQPSGSTRMPNFQTVAIVAQALGLRLNVWPEVPGGRDLTYAPDGDGGY